MRKYISTRNCGRKYTSHEAIIKGLAEDGGLFTPETVDFRVEPEDVIDLDYRETAVKILAGFLDDYTEEELRECVCGAYDTKFDTDEIVPVREISDGFLMDLWHGPTSAFKDLALTILPRLLTKAYEKEQRNDTVAILTATSGDTGKAALSGFADVPHTAVTVFYPEVGVSPVQKRQMQTSKGNNVQVIAVNGNFDDCQRMVKEACSSEEVLSACRNVTISSANSINIGRLVPQIVYYYTTYANLVRSGKIKCGDKITYVVPTGNFGDILAGYLAKKIGLPVEKLICASNSNNVLTDFLDTGTYSLHRAFHTTMSPSMDILISSNLERLLFMVSGYNDEMVRDIMKKLKEDGSYSLGREMMDEIRATFAGYWTDEDTCAKTIRDLYTEENVLIDPHTSVALSALRKYRETTGSEEPAVVLSTASPYKFCKDVLSCVSEKKTDDDFEAMELLHEVTGVKIPENLANLKDLPIRFTRVIEKEDGMHVIRERMEELSNAD